MFSYWDLAHRKKIFTSTVVVKLIFLNGTTHRCTRFLCQRETHTLVHFSLREPFSHSGVRTLLGRWAGQTGLRRRRVVYLALSPQRLLREVSTASLKTRETTKRLKEHVCVQLEASDHARKKALNWGAEILGEPGQSIRYLISITKVVHGSSLCKSSRHTHK